MGTMEELAKLAELKDKGIITEEEFNLKKRQLLAGEPSPAQPSAAELWNPAAIANWSLLIWPVFAQILIAKNWKSMGDEKKAKTAFGWAYGLGIIYIITLATYAKGRPDGSGSLHFITLLIWYFISARAQMEHVKETYGGNYTKKGWMKPLSIVFACQFLLFTVISGVKGTAGSQPVLSESLKTSQQNLLQQEEAEILPTGELAAMFGMGSKYTDVQRESKKKEIMGKVVKWKLTLEDVKKKDDSEYKILTGTSLFADSADREINVVLYIRPENADEAKFLESLQKGQKITVKGQIEGILDTVGKHFHLKPAMVFMPAASAQPVREAAAPPPASSSQSLANAKLTGSDAEKTVAAPSQPPSELPPPAQDAGATSMPDAQEPPPVIAEAADGDVKDAAAPPQQ